MKARDGQTWKVSEKWRSLALTAPCPGGRKIQPMGLVLSFLQEVGSRKAARWQRGETIQSDLAQAH